MTKREFLDTVFALAPNEANAIMDAFDEYVESNVVPTGRSGKERRMTKYIIEIPDDVQYVLLNGKADNKYYTAVRPVAELEVLNSDYINEHYDSLQEEAYKRGINDGSLDVKQRVEGAYQRGLEDAWEAAKKLFSSMADSDIEKAFPIEWNNGGFKALMNLQPQEAIAKLKAYEDKQKDRIEVGDEVATETGKKYTVVSFSDGGTVCGFNMDGKWTGWKPKEVTKTGKHYDIASILEAMRE